MARFAPQHSVCAGEFDLAALEAAILRAPLEARDYLAARYFTPSARRTARLSERDGLLAEMAAKGRCANVEAAIAVHTELLRYATTWWRYGDRDRAAPADPEHAVLHRVLTLNRGEVLGVRSLRRLYAGLARQG